MFAAVRFSDMNAFLLKICLPLAFLLLSCTAAAPSSSADDDRTQEADVLNGRAVKIIDGDTFDLLLSGENRTVRIRLHGVDAPERGQDFYRASKDALGTLLEDAPLRVTATDTDRYRRVVGSIHTASGRWVNEDLVQQGMAWHYVRYSDDARLAAAERSARAARRGLWSFPNPTAPWDWRKQKRAPATR